jgi:hypothetical protein
MFKVSITVILALATILVESAVSRTVGGEPQKPPRFEDYPASRTFQGEPAAVDLQSNPKAWTFRTRLREGAKEEPNFASHFTIVRWGCSTSCHQFAIVDAETGGVSFGPLFWVKLGFRLDSRLLVVNTPESILEYYEGRCPEGGKAISTVTTYFEWDGRELREVTAIDICPVQSSKMSNSPFERTLLRQHHSPP